MMKTSREIIFCLTIENKDRLCDSDLSYISMCLFNRMDYPWLESLFGLKRGCLAQNDKDVEAYTNDMHKQMLMDSMNMETMQ